LIAANFVVSRKSGTSHKHSSYGACSSDKTSAVIIGDA